MSIPVYLPQPTLLDLMRRAMAAGVITGEEADAAVLASPHAGEWVDRIRLRDEFAGQAMQAAATNPTGADGFTFEQRAAWAYQQADAMLKAREQP